MTPSPVETPSPGPPSTLSWDCRFALDATLTESCPLFRCPAVAADVLGPAVISPVFPTLQNQVSLIKYYPCFVRPQAAGMGRL